MENELLNEWKTYTLGEVAEYINGRAFKPSEWSSKGLPIIRIQNLKETSKPYNYFEGDYEERYEVNNGDLLFSWSGTIGTSFGAFKWSRGKAILNQHIFRIEVKNDIVNQDFFRYLLNYYLEKINQEAHGGVGLGHITKASLEKIKVSIPPLDVQKKIVEKLDNFYRDYEILKKEKEKAIKNYNKIMQGVIAKLIDNFKDKSNEVLFNEVATVNGRIGWKGLKRSEYTSKGPMFLSVKNLGEFELKFDDVDHINKVRYEESPEIILKKDDVLLSKDGTIGRVGFVRKLPSETTVNSSIVVIRPIDKKVLLPEFIYRYFQSLNFQKLVESKKTGTCVPHLFQKDIREFSLSIPSIKDQERFIEKMKEIEKLIQFIKQEQTTMYTKINYLPNAVLSKAFNGELI